MSGTSEELNKTRGVEMTRKSFSERVVLGRVCVGERRGDEGRTDWVVTKVHRLISSDDLLGS